MELNVSRVTYNQVSLILSMKEQFLSNEKKIGGGCSFLHCAEIVRGSYVLFKALNDV